MRHVLRFFTARRAAGLAAIVFLALVVRFWPASLTLWPYGVILTWTGNPAVSQTITWHTGRYITSSKLEYQRRGEPFSAVQVAGSTDNVTTDQGSVAVHSVRLTDLEPGTTYQYRVGNGFFWSPYYTFTTAKVKPAPFSFLLFGDTQGYSFDVWQKTIHTAYKRNHAAAFMLNIGDMVDVGLSYQQWADWFRAGSGVIENIPVMAVIGNHETYTSEWKIAQPIFFTAFLHYPDNGPPELKGKVYSFDYGEAHFTVLDTQQQEEAEWIPNLLPLQAAWLKQDLKAATRRWKIVLMHRPLYHNRLSGGDEDLRDAFTPIFDQYQVDAVFAGHDHAYARSYPIKGGKWSNEKGPGPVYFTIGRSGDRTFLKTEAKPWNAVFFNPSEQPNYMTVAVSDYSLQVNVYSLHGEIIDSWCKTTR